ncbi:MAG: glycerol-3-phosphate dehydrogenase (NAD(P)+) [Lentisphaeria bacterium]|jgi:glycerol-3-phosphate dehydrogenase (NAD(P)+)
MTEAVTKVQKYTVAVLGGGSFGTAISNIIAANGHPTFLWMRDKIRAQKCQEIRENPEYLPGYHLHENLTVTNDLAQCVSTSNIVVISVPSQSFRDVTQLVAPYIGKNTIVISTTKGIEAETFCLMSQILEQELSDVQIGVLSGPNFAKEIIENQFTGSVIASDDPEVCAVIQKVFSSKTFRIYSNSDRFGVELGGTLKNIYAIITGMAEALGCGGNTIAMLLTRSLAEMGRFARELGANSMTFLGLAGVGDLFLTCTSDLSRNYRVGYAIGKGSTLDEILIEIGQVAEGVNTLKIVKQKADELGVYMPLVQGLHAILFEDQEIVSVVQGLMLGEMTSDVDLQGGV